MTVVNDFIQGCNRRGAFPRKCHHRRTFPSIETTRSALCTDPITPQSRRVSLKIAKVSRHANEAQHACTSPTVPDFPIIWSKSPKSPVENGLNEDLDTLGSSDLFLPLPPAKRRHVDADMALLPLADVHVDMSDSLPHL